MRKNSSLVGMLICCIVVAACSIITTENRSAEDWLELVNSGLVAEDNFRFTGSVVMGVEDGIALNPFTFEGAIEKHKQIALYAQQSNSFVHNPMSEMEFITKHADKAAIISEGLNESGTSRVVVLDVTVNSSAATTRWKEFLRQELSGVASDAIISAKSSNKHLAVVQRELDSAQLELENMLEQLEVSMKAEVTIDTARIVPLQLKETINMNYVKDESPFNEYRKTNIKFDLSPDKVIR